MLNASSQFKATDGTLTPTTAVRIASSTWLVLLVIPFFFFLYVVWKVVGGSGAVASGVHSADEQKWFLTAMLYLLAVGPLSFFYRSRLFRSYYEGEPVHPLKYLFGMIGVWVAMEIGGLFSLAGCLVHRTMLPEMIPAMIAFMFFVTMWPSGRAMTRRVGHAHAPAVYEEPR